jgi:hypothetical protein
MQGEAVVAFSRRRPPHTLPLGIAPAPGPTMITASRFSSSPIGPFLQLAVAVPARLGGRLGWCVTLLVVDRQDARTGARLNWGFPAQLGTLRWLAEGRTRQLAWDERGVVVSARGRGPKVPLAVPHRELQSRGDGPVMVPDRLLGLFQVAGVGLEAPSDDELGAVVGRHPGTLVGGVHRLMREARTPVGLIAPLRPPVAVTEPLLSDVPRAS